MSKKGLYDEFLINQEMVEITSGKKLEDIETSFSGVTSVRFNHDVLVDIIDALAKDGKIKDDEKSKKIHANHLVFSLAVAREDFRNSNSEENRDTIMRRIFENPVECIISTLSNIKNPSETMKYDYFGCSNCRRYQEMLVDYFGLEDGVLKLDKYSEISSKYGFNPNVVFSWFCNLFLERIRKSKRSNNYVKKK